MSDFIGFGKIARLNREIVVTEKIDGTNAQILIMEVPTIDGEPQSLIDRPSHVSEFIFDEATQKYYNMWFGSRTRWLTTHTDNHGFARWAFENRSELVKLGAGRHFGEWWGQGINRNYGLTEKRFSLFNVSKWGDDNVRPKCCGVVPVLGKFDTFDTTKIADCLTWLRREGSQAAPGFHNPEGIVIYHTHGNVLFKVTLENDDKPKGTQAR